MRHMSRWAGRVGAVVAGLLAALMVTGIAYAHVEVEAEPAVGGSANAVVTFSAEAESSTAGIASVRVVLPAGIAPSDVTLAKAPAGWTLTATADGYEVRGRALPKGTDAVHSVTVARLPNVAELTFKTLVTYSNGSVDRWIGGKSDESPAPVLALTLGPEPTPTTAAPTSAPATTAPASVPAAPASAASDAGGNAWVWLLLGALALVVVVVVVAMAGAILTRRCAKINS
jgi:uncharacterized protein YcnI